MKFVNLKLALIAAAVFLVAAFTLAGWMIFFPGPERGFPYREEAVKLLLQFLLITGLGGIVAATLNLLRDSWANADRDRREFHDRLRKNIAELQTLDSELSRIYRRLKIVKRRLRGQILTCDRDKNGRCRAPYSFAAGPFETIMDDLLGEQVAIEMLRDALRHRSDLLGLPARKRVRKRLRYAARFFHDVHEDLERGRISRHGDRYVAPAEARSFDSLLNSRKLPSDLPVEISDALDRYMAQFDSLSRLRQHAAIRRLDLLRRESGDGRRFRMIADDCFALVSSEIRLAIRRLETRLDPSDPEWDPDLDRAVTNRDHRKSRSNGTGPDRAAQST